MGARMVHILCLRTSLWSGSNPTDLLNHVYETWEGFCKQIVHSRRERQSKESIQGRLSPSDHKMLAFNLLLLLICSIIDIGWVVIHLAITPVKCWHHYKQTITIAVVLVLVLPVLTLQNQYHYHYNIVSRQSQRVNHSILVLALQNLANISWLRPTTLLRRADLNPRTMHVRSPSYFT